MIDYDDIAGSVIIDRLITIMNHDLLCGPKMTMPHLAGVLRLSAVILGIGKI